MSAHSDVSGVHSKYRSRPIARGLYASVAVTWLLFLGWRVWSEANSLRGAAWPLLAWAALLSFVSLLPVIGWRSAPMTADMPVVVAAGLILSPTQIGLVVFLGALDTREVRGQIPLTKALYNRSQMAAASLVGSGLIHLLVRAPAKSPYAPALALGMLGTVTLVNYAFVGVAMSRESGYPFSAVVTRLRIGTPIDFALTFIVSAVLGLMVVALYEQIHLWSLLVIVGPTLLARQVLLRSQMYQDATHAYQSREHALTQISEQISDERTDERRLIAADLHDEVLQPLFKVMLMAHVLKSELSTGRLLEMDKDLPELLEAAEYASRTLREFIGDLRASAVGRGGLVAALSAAVRSIEGQTNAQIETRVAAVEATPTAQLVAYQIAKEALWNSVTHARAKNISLEARQDLDGLHVRVIDDGVGFDPYAETPGHFGLAVMRERAESAGGQIFIDSYPGEGSSVTLFLPNSDPTPT
jgi:signal transduction histidine kinase